MSKHNQEDGTTTQQRIHSGKKPDLMATTWRHTTANLTTGIPRRGYTGKPPITKLEKATIEHHGQKIIVTGKDTCDSLRPGVNPCHQLRSTCFLRQWKLEINLEGSQRAMQVALSKGEGFAVSNSSLKDEASAAAQIIKDQTAHLRITGQWHTPGQSTDHSSF